MKEKSFTRPVGIHVRVVDGLDDVVQKVEQFDMGVAQSFLITESNNYIPVGNQMIESFVNAKKKLDFLYFVHAAYWSGITNKDSKMFLSLQREVELAQDLHADGVVIHIGAVQEGLPLKDQLYFIADCVNTLLDQYPNINLLLENSPHAGRAFGGDIAELAMIKDHVDKKDNVSFCIDTAHAFVYGYDLANEFELDQFINLVKDSIGKESIGLLHFNDASDKCQSRIDKHEAPGKGLIGQTPLTNLMNNELFRDIPLIIELPGNSKDDEREIIKTVCSWQK